MDCQLNMEYRDYYKILGVAKNASTDNIKIVYWRLARKYHPDVNLAGMEIILDLLKRLEQEGGK